jgi:hypothetical protein
VEVKDKTYNFLDAVFITAFAARGLSIFQNVDLDKIRCDKKPVALALLLHTFLRIISVVGSSEVKRLRSTKRCKTKVLPQL